MLIALLILAQTPQHALFRQPNLPRSSLAFFEAFPLSGAGTSGPCSTTAPTGARGETLTFTRASSATCTRTASGGLATTGIQDGDLVSLSSNVARVEYDSAGTLGLLVEAARTNSCLRSQEIDNASWTKYAFGSGVAPTVTADYATAPDGTATADRVQFTAVNAGDQSAVLQAVGITTGTNAVSVYLKGTSGSGSICLAVYSAGAYVTCNFVSTSWSRCTVAGTITAGGTIRIGNDSAVCGGGAMTAQDVLVWGAQFEVGAYATSYIPTTSAAVTRALETMKVNGATFPTATMSKAVTITTEWAQATAPVTWGLLIGEVGTTSGSDFFGVGSGVRTQNCSGSCTSITSGALGIVAGTAMRLAADSSGGQSSIYKNGVLVTGPSALAAAASPWSTTTGVADNGAGVSHLDGIISRICIDPSPERCR